MILCVGTSGSGKSVLLRHLQVHNVVSEGVAGSEGEEEQGASLRSTIPTVGTNLATLSRSRTKKNQEYVADKWFWVIQGWAKFPFPGLVKFVPAVAYHFCLKLPEKFTQPVYHFLAHHCIAWLKM